VLIEAFGLRASLDELLNLLVAEALAHPAAA
jgi:hypothetical protein